MIELTQINEAIEGLSIEGQSRDPLINRGMVIHHGKNCYRFIASFDIKAQIIETLTNLSDKIEPLSVCELEAKVICEKAIIHSLKYKYNTKLNKGSASHKATFWHFPNQTAVRIDRSHPEIQNAIEKRKKYIGL